MKVFTRVAGLLVLGAILLVGPTPTPAATPPTGSIGPTPGDSDSWAGQQYPIGHSTPVPQACPPPDPANVLCDHFFVTVNVPASHWDTNTGGMDVSIEWASVDDDFDLYVFDSSGNQVGFSAAGGTTSERAFVENASTAGSPYEVRVVPFLMASAPLVGYNGTATFVSQAGGPAPNPARSTGGLAFAPPATIVDAQRTEGEPLNFVDQDGNYLDSGPYGFSTGQSWLHRSTDGGNQFNIVSFAGLRPNSPPGGGDTDHVVDDQGDIYFVDLEGLAELSCAVSEDDGNNWSTNQLCVNDTVVDRQWFALDNGTNAGPDGNTVFLAYRQTPRGSFIYSTPGADDPDDPGGGVLYVNSSADLVNPVSQGAPCGQMRFDSVDRYLYYPCIQGDHVEITRAQIAPGQRTGIVYSNVQAPPSPGGGPVGDLFPSVATDAAGNLYAVWIDETDHNVYYAASQDHGTTWGPVHQINGNDANSNEFMWAQGGAPGNLAVAWLGSSSHLDSDFMPSWYNNRQAATQFKWFGYASLIRNAAGSTPTFSQAKFTDQPSHYGQICNQGLFCTVSMGDRTMADYFSLYLDLDGSMRIVFNDTTSQHHGAHVFEVRQVAGPTAFGTTISKQVPTNPVTDPTGDAQSPHYAPTGTGANRPYLDFTKLELSKPNATTLRAKMTLAAPPMGVVPAGETSNVWLTRFQALSVGDEGEESYRIFYVGAESAGGLAPLTFFAGSGRSANNAVPGNGCTTTTAENCKLLQYPSEVAATGNVSGNVITIDVPLQGGFGPNRPILGTTLHNVTALSAGRGNLGGEIADIYADVDATKSFDFPLGGGGPPPPPPEGGCKVTGGGAIPSGAGEGTFGMNPQENLKGKIRYEDGAAADFRSTRLTAVSCNLAARTARIQGEGIDRGQTVEFTVQVLDNGEAGRTDVFEIALSNGYTQGGTLRRGNIQVHE